MELNESQPVLCYAEKVLAENSYLSKLHDAALHNVLRHLSARPRYEDWHNNVSPEDVLSVLRSGGSLSSCANSEFIHLHASPTLQTNTMHALHVEIKNKDDRNIFEELLAELAPALQCFTFSYAKNKREFNILESCKRCVSLRYLYIGRGFNMRDFRELLRACSGNLRELVIVGRRLSSKSIKAIADHCTGLMKFKVWHVHAGLVSVWKTIGPSFVDLAISMDRTNCSLSNTLNVVDEITFYCVKVCSLEVHGSNYTPRGRETPALLVQFCEQFSSQLTSLKISEPAFCLYPAQIGNILDACPDLLVDAFFNLRHGQLEIFRDRVRALRITGEYVPDDEEAGEAVSNLQELSITHIHRSKFNKFLRLFSSIPKPDLKALHVRWIYKPASEEEENSFDLLARLVTSLEVLTVECASMLPQEYQRIAIANQGLKRVSISHCDKRTPRPEPAIASCVEDFSHCPILVELVLNSNVPPREPQSIAEACVAFRGRRVDIFICGRQYSCR